MICPFCYNEIPNVYRFCLQCGAELCEDTVVTDGRTLRLPETVAAIRLEPTIAALPSSVPANPSYPLEVELAPQQDSDVARPRWFIAGAVSLILLIIVAALIVTSSMDSEPGPSAPVARLANSPTPYVGGTPNATSTPTRSPTATPTATPDPWKFIGSDSEQTIYYKPDSLQSTSSDTCVVWTESIPLDRDQKREAVIADRTKQGLSTFGYENYWDTQLLVALRCQTSEWSIVEISDYAVSGRRLSSMPLTDEKREWSKAAASSPADKLLRATCSTFCCDPGTQ